VYDSIDTISKWLPYEICQQKFPSGTIFFITTYNIWLDLELENNFIKNWGAKRTDCGGKLQLILIAISVRKYVTI